MDAVIINCTVGLKVKHKSAEKEIAPLFYHAIDCENVILPKEFDNIVQEIHDRFIRSFDFDAERTE